MPSAPLYYVLTWPVVIPTFFFKTLMAVPLQTPNDKQCLPLGLCKGTVKESTTARPPLRGNVSLFGTFVIHVMAWEYFSRYCRFVKGIHRWSVGSFNNGPLLRLWFCFSNKLLNKQSSCYGFAMSWRHCHGTSVFWPACIFVCIS